MPQELLKTSLIGQQQAVSFGLGQFAEGLHPIYQFSGVSTVGAIQERPGSVTAALPEEALLKLPTGASLEPPLDVTIERARPALQTRQLWEGTVTEVADGQFVAVLSDRTNPGYPDESGRFEFSELSAEDQALVAPGSVFYWVVGTERTVGGQVRNVSMVQFRRTPAWTLSAVRRVTESAQRLAEVFRTESEPIDTTKA